jgi:ribosomal protein L32
MAVEQGKKGKSKKKRRIGGGRTNKPRETTNPSIPRTRLEKGRDFLVRVIRGQWSGNLYELFFGGEEIGEVFQTQKEAHLRAGMRRQQHAARETPHVCPKCTKAKTEKTVQKEEVTV